MKKVDDIKRALARARAEAIVLRRRWTAKTQDCLAAVGDHCDGSEERVADMGYAIAGQRPAAARPSPAEDTAAPPRKRRESTPRVQ